MRSALRAAAAALIALIVLCGCSPGSHPLARVGSHTLTVDDLARLARGSEGNFPPVADQARVLALDEMVRRELLLIAARRRGTDTSATEREFRRTTEEKMLVQALNNQLVPFDVGVSEAEARAFYAQRDTQNEVNLVYTADRPTVDQALAALAAGRPFAMVADRYNSPGLLPPGGAVGMLQSGALPAPLDEAMRTQKLGAVGGPYETPQGWFLLQITRRTPAHQEAFELEHESLVNALRQRKQRTMLNNALLDLEREVHLRIAPDAAQTMFRLLSSARVPETPHWMPTAQERQQKLATFDGGSYTLDDLLTDMVRNDGQVPNAAVLASLRAWIEGRAMLRAEQLEARRRHLDQEPAYVHQLESTIANHLVEIEATAALASAPAPGEAQVRAEWEKAKNANPQLKQVHVQWIVLRDTTRAEAIARGCRAGKSLRDAVHDVDASLHVQDQVVHFPGRDPAWAPLFSVLDRLQPGQLSGPDFMNDGWHMTLMLDKTQGPVSWEELPRDLQGSVATKVAQNMGAMHFGVYVDSLRRVTPTVLYTENLRRLPWPIPAPVEVGR